ncbi:hypothetical protein [Spirosoma koreense]
MVNDLLSDYKIKGKGIGQVVELLGQPDGVNSNTIFYKITEEFNSDIDPIKGKHLVLFYNKDSTVTNVRLEEWGK